MKSKLLNKNAYESVCRNCRHGRLSPEGGSVLCVKKGITDPDGTCRRYSYDPLKRIPRKPLSVSPANPEDFDLSIGFEELPIKEEAAAQEYEASEANAYDEPEIEQFSNEETEIHEEANKKLWTATRLIDMEDSEDSE